MSNFNGSEWARQVKRQLQQGIEAQLRDRTREVERAFRAIERDHGGKPLDEVLPHVRGVDRQCGLGLTEAQMRGYAEGISTGAKITFSYEVPRIA